MDRFNRAMRLLAVHEGGYSNHPNDPGGATMRGVTQRVYDAWRLRQGQEPQDVRSITDDEVSAIYRRQYWDAVRADDLPPGLAYAVFDAAVNSGPARAARWLQAAAGAAQDGIVGVMTLEAVSMHDVEDLIDGVCDLRLAFMRRLPHWPTFRNGWERRVSEVRAQALKWAEGYEPVAQPPTDHVPDMARAEGNERITAAIADAMRDPRSIGAVGSTATAVATAASAEGPVAYALAALLVLAAVAAVVLLMRRRD